MMPEIVIESSRSISPVSQLVGQIKRSVLTDQLAPGAALPPVRQLARDLGLDERVVASAYGVLVREAIVRPRSFRGPVVDGQGKARLHRLLDTARASDVHDRLLSPVRLTSDRVEALGYSRPLAGVGGDVMDVVEGEGSTDLFLGDVAGHGLGAGLVMAMVKSSLRMGLRRQPSLPDLVADANGVLEETTGPRFFATLACLRIDRAGRLEYLLAGHHHITRYRAADETLSRLDCRGLPLGLFGEATYESRPVTLAQGDLLAVYTDGLNETRDRFDVELGHEAIERTLAAVADQPLETIREAVFDTVGAHGPQADDRSLLLVRRTG